PMYNRADRYIAECRNGRSLSASPIPAEVALVPGINSAHADYGPLPTADGSTLYFTSRRAGTTGGKRNKVTNEYFEDIYA
ncbi:MAG: PD40 domain-containing protein, partial [Flavobacteriales bacterium]|nr:PD40 domain-containing protein [Flavobacteriales bacterium]